MRYVTYLTMGVFVLMGTSRATPVVYSQSTCGTCEEGGCSPQRCGPNCQGRCQYCVDGQCYPRRQTYGHYQTQWRRWPVPDLEPMPDTGPPKLPRPELGPATEVPSPFEETRMDPEFPHLRKRAGGVGSPMFDRDSATPPGLVPAGPGTELPKTQLPPDDAAGGNEALDPFGDEADLMRNVPRSPHSFSRPTATKRLSKEVRPVTFASAIGRPSEPAGRGRSSANVPPAPRRQLTLNGGDRAQPTHPFEGAAESAPRNTATGHASEGTSSQARNQGLFSEFNLNSLSPGSSGGVSGVAVFNPLRRTAASPAAWVTPTPPAAAPISKEPATIVPPSTARPIRNPHNPLRISRPS